MGSSCGGYADYPFRGDGGGCALPPIVPLQFVFCFITFGKYSFCFSATFPSSVSLPDACNVVGIPGPCVFLPDLHIWMHNTPPRNKAYSFCPPSGVSFQSLGTILWSHFVTNLGDAGLGGIMSPGPLSSTMGSTGPASNHLLFVSLLALSGLLAYHLLLVMCVQGVWACAEIHLPLICS